MRLAIINHDTHQLFIEDVDDKLIEEKYDGNEQDYILDNYAGLNQWSWDYVTDVEYIPRNGDPIPVKNFKEDL